MCWQCLDILVIVNIRWVNKLILTLPEEFSEFQHTLITQIDCNIYFYYIIYISSCKFGIIYILLIFGISVRMITTSLWVKSRIFGYIFTKNMFICCCRCNKYHTVKPMLTLSGQFRQFIHPQCESAYVEIDWRFQANVDIS